MPEVFWQRQAVCIFSNCITAIAVIAIVSVTARQFSYSNCGYGYYFDGFNCVGESNWQYWGRYVVTGWVAFCILLILLSCW